MTRTTRLITVFAVLLSARTATAQFVPDGLRPGDVYHLVFLTDGWRDAIHKPTYQEDMGEGEVELF